MSVIFCKVLFSGSIVHGAAGLEEVLISGAFSFS